MSAPSHIIKKRLEYIAPFVFRELSPTPPLPATSELVGAVAFSFLTSTLVLGALPMGYRFNRVAALIETPFDDPAATVSLGTSADIGLLLGAGDVRPNATGQYESDALVPILASDVLLLTVHPGLSTQGAGLLLYKVLPP